MIPAHQTYNALYTGRADKPVVAWDDDGQPLVMRMKELVRADLISGLVGLEEVPPVVAVLPPGEWVARYKDDDGTLWATPLVGWVVRSDGNALPLVATSDGLAGDPTEDGNFDSVWHPAWDEKDK